MSTFLDCIYKTRQHLMTNQPDRLNVLTGTIDNAVTTLILTHEAKGISEGSRLSIDLEELYVIAISSSAPGATVTVIRGYNGSTPAAHIAATIVYVNPQFSNYWIGEGVNDAMDNLSADGLFQIKAIEFPYSSTALGYDLPADDFIDVWRVRYNEPGPIDHWMPIEPPMFYVDLDSNTTTFPSGKSIVLRDGGYNGYDVRVSYLAPFTQLVNLTDDLLTVGGLHNEAHDLPAIKAAISLLSGRDVKRTFLNRQPEPRRQEEVPVGGASQAMRPLLQLYNDRLAVEVRRLRRKYPGA